MIQHSSEKQVLGMTILILSMILTVLFRDSCSIAPPPISDRAQSDSDSARTTPNPSQQTR